MKTDRLIDTLVAEAQPVRRLRPPLVRAGLWLGGAAALIAGITLFHAHVEGESLRHLFGQFADPGFTLQWFASLATGITAIIAAFELSLPDRSRAWRLLPLPAVAAWLLLIGYGCLTDWVERGPDGWVAGHSLKCLGTIIGTSVPLGAFLAWMLRFAGAAWPVETITVGALGTAALSATGLSLYHDLDASLMILIWHGGTTALIVWASRTIGQRVFRRA
ncbi:MAG: NrsF family protein [Zavarzinia sp.]|nr:NrsF family protein [Zavarzinia sp.]